MWLLLACTASPVRTVHFVRDGLVRTVGGVATFEVRAWSPGDEVDGAVAPRIAECVPLFSVALGDVGRHVAAGGEAPDTALAFSPDGRSLAVGTFLGDLLVLDAHTGAELGRRHWPEAMVKRIAWSPDGTVLWAGEQSPDGAVYALDARTLADRGRFRLANELGGGEPPPGDDLYARYALPGVYGLVADEGGAWVTGAHGWTDGTGTRHNRSRVWRLRPDASVVAAWPAGAPADAIFSGLAWDGATIAVPVRRSAEGPAPVDIPVNGIALLDSALRPRAEIRIPPLIPWFDGVFIGDGLALADGEAWAGLGDGRIVHGPSASGGIGGVLPIGTPDADTALPLAATIGWLASSPGGVVAVTTRTVIPYGAAAPELRPPSLHPAENAVLALDPSGGERWRWQGPHDLQGLATSDRWVVVGAGARIADDRRDLFGALVLEPATGALAATCPTSGPVFYDLAVSADGRVAVTEVPFRASGGVAGAYRVTVLR